jgi:protein-S-isoprenylcysteine O-methyltransferase Ste14
MAGRCGCSAARDGLLPGQATHAIIEEGPYRLSRNPLYVGLLALYLGLALLAPTFWGLVLFPAAVLLVLWGAIRPRSGSCTSGSVRRTTTTRAGFVAGCER